MGSRPDVDQRVTAVAHGADLSAVADALRGSREPIVGRWLEVTARQPFHRDRPDGAVADHIPELFDAIVELLARSAPADEEVDAPLDDPAIVAAATAHAQVRFDQGLGPAAVVTEFRLLRQEIGRALTRLLDDREPATDVVASLTIVGDALDGAATVGLMALSDRIETIRESFLATTVHDVRQPITLVEGSLHLADRWLGAETLDTERLREVVRDALSATLELAAMIDTLSDASRIAMGELDPDPEPASLEDVVSSSIAAFGETARDRVTLDMPGGRHLIGLWDVRLLHRLVGNLVGNALKYSAPGGKVAVVVEPGASRSARLVVRDTGIGMSLDELTGVFERFVRSDRARESGVPGLGLGLYACRGIVLAHGGTIDLDSAGPGAGTTVTVELPLLDEDAADAEGEPGD
ncbi:MAG: ATP-binding protein [Candidatus Limnocylindrales bacterium]